METKTIDALRLWWRDINFTTTQRKALAAVAIFAVAMSGFLIFRPQSSEAITPPLPANASTIVPTIVSPPMVVIDVAGDVKTPGVYELPINSRVNDAIKAAGGINKTADLSFINRARVLRDGEQIFIDKKITNSTKTVSRSTNISGVININRATAKELDKLSGIGPVIAGRIIEYRKVHGFFTTIEDLKKVKGIGVSTLEKFKSKIRV